MAPGWRIRRLVGGHVITGVGRYKTTESQSFTGLRSSIKKRNKFLNNPAAAVVPGLRAKHLPGEEGIWVFVLGDMLLFALFFGTFLFYRNEQTELFLQSQLLLNKNYGVVNTLLLLTSSWFVATAVHMYRRNNTEWAARLLASGFLCGLGFAIIKVVEFSEKIKAGITLNSNDFFMFYFMFTGIHFLHVLIGLGVLFFATHAVLQKPDGSGIRSLENGATFWHMVDLLWIVLFPLIYLLK